MLSTLLRRFTFSIDAQDDVSPARCISRAFLSSATEIEIESDGSSTYLEYAVSTKKKIREEEEERGEEGQDIIFFLLEKKK